MELLYYKSKKGNFGDDLNLWLWPKLFHNLNKNSDALLVGIGSLLNADSPIIQINDNRRKIVFGTGVRPAKSYRKFETDESWDIRFLRGPISSLAFGNRHKFISDGAYALRHTENIHDFSVKKKYKIGLMPYFHSVDFFDWRSIAEDLGYHYISPLSEDGVESTLNELASCEFIITEAMHGAILADAFRIPWSRFVLSTPVTEGERISDFKWNDWLGSINKTVDTTHIPFLTKNSGSKWVKSISGGVLHLSFFNKVRVKDNLVKSLRNVVDFSLSDDATVKRIDEQIYEEIQILRSQDL